MPSYTYRCEKCGTTFVGTETMSEHEAETAQCPTCGSKKVAVLPGHVFVITTKKS